MAQIFRFFAWIAWGVVSTVIIVGLLTSILFEGASSLAGAFAEPEIWVILIGAYVPGTVLYSLGIFTSWLNAREAAQSSKSTPEPNNPEQSPQISEE